MLKFTKLIGALNHLTTTDEEQEVTAEEQQTVDSSSAPAKRRGVIVIVAILVLIIGLGAINWLFPAQSSQAEIEQGTALTQTGGEELAEASGPTTLTPPLLGLATPWGVIGRDNQSQSQSQSTATPSSTAQAATPAPPPAVTVELPAEAMIQLLGPPANSSFRLDDPVSFYWDWPLALGPNQRFAVYLRAGSDEWLLGAVEHNNLGSAYRLRAELTELVSQPAQYEWLVRLELLPEGDGDRPQPLRESEIRPLLLLGD